MSDDNKEQIIELDDPRLQESQTYDPDQDINQRIPPPELDENGNVLDYLFKVTLGENKQGKKELYPAVSKSGKAYVAVPISLQIIQPGGQFDKAFINYPYGMVTTSPFNNTNGVVDMYRRLSGDRMPTGLSQAEQAKMLQDLLLSEPTAPGRLIWDAPYCQNCEEEKKQFTGEKNWPEKDGGGHIPLRDCPDCGTGMVPKVSLKRFIST